MKALCKKDIENTNVSFYELAFIEGNQYTIIPDGSIIDEQGFGHLFNTEEFTKNFKLL